MSRGLSRRAFCRWCVVAVSPDAIPYTARASRRRLLIGVLSTVQNDAAIYAELERQLKDSLPEYAEGLDIVRREAGRLRERLRSQIDELLGLHPRVLICLDLTAALTAAERRGNVDPPIVFLAHDDPLQTRLIESYARPGRNLTGVTTFRCLDGKMVEIMAEAFPSRRHFGYLLDQSVNNAQCTGLAEAAARSRGVKLSIVDVSQAGFIAEMSSRLAPLGLDAIVAPASTVLWQNPKPVVDSLNALRLPAIYEGDRFLAEGGLMYYAPIRSDAIAQVALDVRKIIQGNAAGDLPVEQPTLFELVINLRAPHAVEYDIRPTTLRRADRILQ
jgi:putative tryptophan/tyrosine transport system substrate-binding protein